MSDARTTQKVYRIDKFKVPVEARSEFLERVHMTHAILRTLPGFAQDLVLEQTGGPGVFNFVTVAIWASPAAVEHAKEVVTTKHRDSGFNPKDVLKRLNVEADVAYHTEVHT